MVTASIVLYKTERKILINAINSFLNSEVSSKLYLIDNSPTNKLRDIFLDQRVLYIHNPSNLGFGAAHNIAIKEAIIQGAKYHFIINPDVYFNKDVISPMVEYMNSNKNVGMMMPQILNDDGSIQNLPKLLPSPYSVLMRKIKKPRAIYESFISKYELRFVQENVIYDTPILSGCFTLLNIKAIKEIGMYDDIFFMYFEDWDLSRRMHKKYKAIYYPLVSIYHGYESGANKNSRLFKIFVSSAIKYFNKWGWFFDKDRKKINKEALAQFK